MITAIKSYSSALPILWSSTILTSRCDAAIISQC